MLDENYNVKVIDFGDARKVNDEAFGDSDEDGNDQQQELHNEIEKQQQKQARRGTFVGTVNYQTPEVINEEEQTCAIDIWALGCILFKMFVGKVPFKGTNPAIVYKDIKSRNIQWPEPDVLETIMSKEACDLINRMI